MSPSSVPIITIAFLLNACNSGLDNQIEKCVQAGMHFKEPFVNDTVKAEMEFKIRNVCLQSSAGK
jgi:hypothetical protein